MNQSNLIGTTILDKFRVDSVIGSGGMSTVYRVWDMSRQTYLVMKVIRTDISQDSRAIRLFEREAQILAKLAHPNIVRFYGFFRSENLSFVLIDFINGITLRERMGRKSSNTFSIFESLCILKAISSAVGYAHSQGFIHGDIKPENILIDNYGNIFVSDFGLARLISDTRVTALAGTPRYMAPELIKNDTLTPRSDVYALGILAYEILTGHWPFESATNIQDILNAQVNSEPIDSRKYNNQIPKELSKIIGIALEKEPSHRFGTTHEFFEAVCKATNTDASTIPTKIDLDFDQNYAGKVPITEEGKTEDKVDILIPLKQTFRFNPQPLRPTQDSPLIGRDDDVQKIITRLLYSDGGAYLIAGYRGVGKTSYINKVIGDILDYYNRQRTKEQHTELISVRINLPKAVSPSELMYLIIRGLYRKLLEANILDFMETSTKQELTLAEQRISSNLEQKVSDSRNLEFGGGFGQPSNIGVSFGRKGSHSTETVKSYRDYHASAAEQDLISILEKIQKPIVKNRKLFGIFNTKRHKIVLRIIIILDELDRIDNFDALNEMITQLKTLFTMSGVNFLFIAGKDLYLRWLADLRKMDSTFEGVFSAFDLYLPCLWNCAEDIVNLSVVQDSETWKISSKTLTRPDFIYTEFTKYLSFVGRGLPRRIHRAFGKFVVQRQEKPFMELTRREIRRIKFYAGLQEWLIENERRFINPNFEFSMIDRDSSRIALYYLLDWILFFGNHWFTIDDVSKNLVDVDAVLQGGQRLTISTIESIVEQLCVDEYLEKSVEKYRLRYRRFIEIGGAPEKLDVDNMMSLHRSLDIVQPVPQPNAYNDIKSVHNVIVTALEVSHFGRLPVNEIANPWDIRLNMLGSEIKIEARESGGERYVLNSKVCKDKLDIGRAQDNDVQLFQDSVSRYHARLVYVDTDWYLYDMNTINKTLLNGKPTEEKQLIFSDDIIEIAHTRFIFTQVKK